MWLAVGLCFCVRRTQQFYCCVCTQVIGRKLKIEFKWRKVCSDNLHCLVSNKSLATRDNLYRHNLWLGLSPPLLPWLRCPRWNMVLERLLVLHYLRSFHSFKPGARASKWSGKFEFRVLRRVHLSSVLSLFDRARRYIGFSIIALTVITNILTHMIQ